jgi:hypothetical protein
VKVQDPRGACFVDPKTYRDMDEWHARVAEIRRDAPVLRVEAEGFSPFWAITDRKSVV